jgi:hypothetical protein
MHFLVLFLKFLILTIIMFDSWHGIQTDPHINCSYNKRILTNMQVSWNFKLDMSTFMSLTYLYLLVSLCHFNQLSVFFL